MSSDHVAFFDTTLRDGEQSPGCSMTTQEKLTMAHALEDLGVDIVEAGFAMASEGDFAAIATITQAIRKPRIASLARARTEDIQMAARALQFADRARIHVFLASSDLHLEYKLKISRQQALEQAAESVRLARSLVDDVEFSPEDATRSNRDFLVEMVRVAIEAGATTINMPDTVGYTTPDEYRAKWGLAADYPMVAPNYAAQRSELAKKIGLGQIRKDRVAKGKSGRSAKTADSDEAGHAFQ